MSNDLAVVEFDPRAVLIRGFRNFHNSRARTLQEEIGPSSIGDCRRKVYHQIKKTPETNPDVEILASILGIFIHEGIEKIMAAEDDPFTKHFFMELEARYGDMPGHIDLYVDNYAIVVDWKTTTKKNLKNFPSEANLYQVHNYGLMMKTSGKPVKKVALVVIPRDGRMDEIAQYIGDYNEELAFKGQDWLDDIYEIVDNNKRAPEPEKIASQFCARYCPFYDKTARVGCPGL